MIIMRKIPCLDSQTGEAVDVEDPVAAFGPFSQVVAHTKAERFNRSSADGSRVTLLDPEPEEYRPVPNAPDFIAQQQWPEHWAIVRPMNWHH